MRVISQELNIYVQYALHVVAICQLQEWPSDSVSVERLNEESCKASLFPGRFPPSGAAVEMGKRTGLSLINAFPAWRMTRSHDAETHASFMLCLFRDLVQRFCQGQGVYSIGPAIRSLRFGNKAQGVSAG